MPSLDDLYAQGLISDRQLARNGYGPSPADAASMTHQAEQPNPAAPYLNAATNFARPLWEPGARGGIVGAMQGAGSQVPSWATAPQGVLNNPSANMALGMLSPLKAFGALGEGVGAAQAFGEHPARVDQRLPTGVGSAGASPQNLTVDLDAARMVPDSYNKNVDLLRDYPNMPAKLSRKAPDTVADGFVNHVSDNLKWLWNQVQPEVRDRSKLWYDGGNKIVNDWANEFGLKDSTIAGTIAAMSPQKDWFQNVSLARRALEITRDPTVPATPEMAAQFSARPALQKYAPLFDRINGKSLSDIDGMTDLEPAERTTLKALWVRLRDEAHNDPSYRVVTPEGDFGDPVKTKSGSNSSVAWGSLGEIGKAVNFIDANDPALPQTLLGEKHKVRNFYNNLLAPNSAQGDVTIDTHAVAAGLLRPFSANSMEVAHNFNTYAGKGLPGASGSDVTGVRGTYPFYADAYRKAAADLGVLPRQLQSVTWEAVRNLFPDTMKNDKFSAQIDGLWNQYRKGRAGLDDTRSAILDAAGASNGIKPPAWFGAGRSNDAPAAAGGTSYTPELSGPGLPREAAGNTERGGGGQPALPASAQSSYARGLISDQAANTALGAISGPESLWHGSLTSGIQTLKAGTHIGTRQAATERLERMMGQSNEQRFPGAAKVGEEQPTLYPVNFHPQKVLDIGDGSWSPESVASVLRHQGDITNKEYNQIIKSNDFTKVLRNKGYDALRYENNYEDVGSHSYVLLHDYDMK